MARAKSENASLGTPLRSYLRRRKWIVALRFAAVAGAIAALSWADRHGWFLHDGSDMTRYDGKTFRVVHVVDGDTADLDVPDGKHAHTRVRFWGVNSPEIEHPNSDAPAQPFGHDAAAFTRRRIEGRAVEVALVSDRVRDRFGRLLAYLRTPEGTTINEELVAQGLARADDRWDHPRQEHFALLERQAKYDRLNMWSQSDTTRRARRARDENPATQP